MTGLPSELIEQVLIQLEGLLVPHDPTCPDPFVELAAPPPGSQLPSLSPQPGETARQVWHTICLVDAQWSGEARRFMWSSVAIARPRAFESILRTIEEYGGGPSGVSSRRTYSTDRSLSPAVSLDEPERGRPTAIGPSDDTKWSMLSHVGVIDTAQKPVLEAVRLAPGHSPLLWTRIISFSRFRTAGLRRSIRQGSKERFVTPPRLIYLLKGTRPPRLEKPFENYLVSEESPTTATTGRLEAVGFTEFMDSAISVEVLEELLFRGGWMAEYFVTTTTFRPAPFPAPSTSTSTPVSRFAPRTVDVPPTHHEETENEHSSAAEESDSAEEATTESSGPSSSSPSSEDDSGDDERGRSTAVHSLTPVQRSSLSPAVQPVRPVLRSASSGSRGMSTDRSVAFAERPTIMPRRPSRLRHSSTSRHRAPKLERRPSGSVFSTSGNSNNEDEEGRGRSRRTRPTRDESSPHRSSASARSHSVPASAPHDDDDDESPGSHRASSVPPTSREAEVHEVRAEIRHEGSKSITPIRALDLCACVSPAFINSLEEFCSSYRLGHPPRRDEESAFHRIFFPHLRRLGLASLLIPSSLLTTFVSSFPNLTHLDLTSTLATPALLAWLAQAGQDGTMRLDSLSLARCRLLTGASIVGLLCGDCPPFTSTAGMQDDPLANFKWGKGESTKHLKDLSLFGDLTKPIPLSQAELRLVLTVAPALTSNFLRTLDLSSAPIDDAMLELFPFQPHLIELGLACCRQISVRAVASLLQDRCPSVEVIDLSFSCPAAVPARRPGHAMTMSSMELHTQLIAKVASTKASSHDRAEADRDLAARKTHLRVIELDEKALEAIQGGAGDWKIIWGKGRRGWYVDTATVSEPNSAATPSNSERPRRLRHCTRDDPRRKALLRLSQLNGVVPGDVGWHARKMEVLTGQGMMGREDGLYVFHAYQV